MEGLISSIKTILKRPRGGRRVVSPEPNPLPARPRAIRNVNSTTPSVEGTSTDDSTIGVLQRPWRRIRRQKLPDSIFMMARRNYKVNALIGKSIHAMRRFVVVLDTGAGSSFIKKSVLPPSVVAQIQPVGLASNVRDASNRRVNIIGTVNLTCQVGMRTDIVRFNVVEKLGTDVIIGCDYCDKHIEAIRPRKRVVEMDDGTTVPIIRKPSGRSIDSVPLPEEQEWIPAKGRRGGKVHVTESVTLPPETQTWVKVRTEEHGLVMIDPNARMYDTHLCLAGNGIAQVNPGKEFQILVANFGNHPKRLTAGQRIATAKPHPTSIVESKISHAELFGLTDAEDQPSTDGTNSKDESETNQPNEYRKRNYNARDAAVINKHLADLRESHMSDDETPVKAEDIDISDVDEKYHEEIRAMLKKHETIWNGKLGHINVLDHNIELVNGARPFKSPPYRAGPKTRELESFEIKKQLDAGIIEPSQSEWSAPVLFVPKKDGKLRFCIDYRKLNEMTIKDSYPLPRMDECIDSLGEATIFTTLDAYSGYWQMPVRESDRHKTAFVCHAGTYQYTRMPFGLTNAPASFQRALDFILTKYKWKTCLVYLDDVIIYSKSVEDHIRHVDEILECLAAAGVTLKMKKCKFFTTTVEYLGHIIKPGKLEVDQANTESLRKAQPPTNRSELRSFLGFCNVYRRFIKDFTRLAGPINKLLKKNSPDQFILDEEQLKAFRALIDCVIHPPVLALPISGLKYSVDTDASAYGIGCALFQTHEDGERKPIGYWSRTLNDAERNYSASERECLAVVWALKTLRPYLLYEEFIVHTDHAALRWLLTIQEPSGRLVRWRLRLAEFNFQVMYKKGKENQQADALSRLRTLAETIQDDWDEIPSFMMEEEINENDHSQVDRPIKHRFKHQRKQHFQQKCETENHSEDSEVNEILLLDVVQWQFASYPFRRPLIYFRTCPAKNLAFRLSGDPQ